MTAAIKLMMSSQNTRARAADSERRTIGEADKGCVMLVKLLPSKLAAMGEISNGEQKRMLCMRPCSQHERLQV